MHPKAPPVLSCLSPVIYATVTLAGGILFTLTNPPSLDDLDCWFPFVKAPSFVKDRLFTAQFLKCPDLPARKHVHSLNGQVKSRTESLNSSILTRGL
jgi:hypothetical protein